MTAQSAGSGAAAIPRMDPDGYGALAVQVETCHDGDIRSDCIGSLAADGGHCFHSFDDEPCCWCEDDCDCHDDDFGAAGVLGVHRDDDEMALARAQGESR